MEWTLLFDALSFLVAFLTLLAMRVPSSARSVTNGERAHFGREFLAGLRFFFESGPKTILIAGVIVLFGAGAINALDIFFTTQNLHATIPEYGVLSGAAGLACSWLYPRRDLRRAYRLWACRLAFADLPWRAYAGLRANDVSGQQLRSS